MIGKHRRKSVRSTLGQKTHEMMFIVSMHEKEKPLSEKGKEKESEGEEDRRTHMIQTDRERRVSQNIIHIFWFGTISV